MRRAITLALAAVVTVTLATAAVVMIQGEGRKPQPGSSSKPGAGAGKTADRTQSQKQTAKKPAARSAPARPARRPELPPSPRTVGQVLDSIRGLASARYRQPCVANKIVWPPARLVLLAFKRERILEVWAANGEGAFKRIGTHKIIGASGGLGPKRKQGDLQVPEGFYRLTELNPNSVAHLSVRVDYPNAVDIANSKVARSEMGGDIYVHGHWLSFGCLAIGDRAIEELFPLIAQVPAGNRDIVIAPFDFRRSPKAAYPREERWVHNQYDRIKRYLAAFPAR